MAHALRLAARGLGNTWPNPAVGCVLVKDGQIVGRGWTQAGGRPHAEVRALDQARRREDASRCVYITLAGLGDNARRFADQHQVEVLSGAELARLLRGAAR